MDKFVDFIWQSANADETYKVMGGFHWLKSVIDFNDTKHCKYCLVGKDCKDLPRFPSPNKEYKIRLQHHADELVPPHKHNGEIMHYYCFVSDPYRWERNMHIPFIYKEGSVAMAEKWDGDKIIFRNAEFLPFDDKKTKELYSHLGHFFVTCRNFQFAAHYFR